MKLATSPPLKILLTIVWITSPFLYFLTTYFSIVMTISVISFFLYFSYFLILLVTGRFRRAMMNVTPIVVAIPLVLLLGEKSEFYFREGFRLHMALVGSYSSTCHLEEFYMSGASHYIGLCEIRNQRIVNDLTYVIYDSSGEITLPASQRDPDWRRATALLNNGNMLVNENLPVSHITGPYYAVSVTLTLIAGYV